MEKAPRHKWGEPRRDVYRTERKCKICDLVKVTRHEPHCFPWVEFEFDGQKVDWGGKTPPCVRD